MEERTLEFLDFKQEDDLISANLYVNGKFIFTLTNSITDTLAFEHKDLALYEYFRQAVMYYVEGIDPSMHNNRPN